MMILSWWSVPHTLTVDQSSCLFINLFIYLCFIELFYSIVYKHLLLSLPHCLQVVLNLEVKKFEPLDEDKFNGDDALWVSS